MPSDISHARTHGLFKLDQIATTLHHPRCRQDTFAYEIQNLCTVDFAKIRKNIKTLSSHSKMVLYSKDDDIHNDYWKIQNWSSLDRATLRYGLIKHGYHCPTRTETLRLVEMASRAERGLLPYGACTLRELQSFIVQRGLLTPEVRKPGMWQLTTVLETADDEAVFDRFVDLPPELRAHIYTLHFDSLPALEDPAQPPITRVSRSVRKESLPLFYKTCTFKLEDDIKEGKSKEGDGEADEDTCAKIKNTFFRDIYQTPTCR